MTRLAVLLLAAAAAPVLSGCGIRGDLDRPPPIWGPDDRETVDPATRPSNADDRPEVDAREDRDTGAPS
ncbi:MAG: lipoprotein [Oceanicaulis sp.]